MDAGKRTINELFTGSRLLEIPFFQRAYVWDEPQWTRLLEDVEELCSKPEPKPYFLGSVILKQQPTSSGSKTGDIRTIIDGQQRLTTLSILLKTLCLKTNELRKFDRRFRLDDDSIVILHNHNDDGAFNKVMEQEKPAKLAGEDRITRAYNYFLKEIKAEKLNFDTICDYVMFVGIDLTADEDEQQIFDTINSLGVRLTTAELLKNYFFNRNDLTLYNTYWRDVFEKDEETKAYWDQEVTTGRFRRTFIDLFFYAFLQIKMQDAGLRVKAEDKSVFSNVVKLFDSYKEFIRTYLPEGKISLLGEIKEYAEVFRRTIRKDVSDEELTAQAGVDRLNVIIFNLDTATLIPYLLFVERNVENDAEKVPIYEYLESYIMRRLVCKESTKNYNQLFAERLILNRVLTKDALVAWISTQDDKVNRMPTDAEVATAFSSVRLTNKYATGVLYLIESKIRNRAFHSTQLLGINKYSLEHMMPKKWRNNWKFSGSTADADLRDGILLTLGNLTIITQSLNASIRDADWATKRAGQGDKGGLQKYADGIETLSKYLSVVEWDEDAIAERAQELSRLALDCWHM